jgi:hypothetical protein
VFLILTGIFATFFEEDDIQWTGRRSAPSRSSSSTSCCSAKPCFARRSTAGRNVKLYTSLAAFLAVWWLLYPVAWALGPQGADW